MGDPTFKMMQPGLEPGTSGSVDRCLNHWAIGPSKPTGIPKGISNEIGIQILDTIHQKPDWDLGDADP